MLPNTDTSKMAHQSDLRLAHLFKSAKQLILNKDAPESLKNRVASSLIMAVFKGDRSLTPKKKSISIRNSLVGHEENSPGGAFGSDKNANVLLPNDTFGEEVLYRN